MDRSVPTTRLYSEVVKKDTDLERMLLKRGMGNGEWDDSGEWEIEMGI